MCVQSAVRQRVNDDPIEIANSDNNHTKQKSTACTRRSPLDVYKGDNLKQFDSVLAVCFDDHEVRRRCVPRDRPARGNL